MRYLIVGGTSVFGEGLIDRLLDKDDTEEIITTKLEKEKAFQKEGLKWVDLDLRDVSSTNRLIENSRANIIFDFATQDSVGYSWEQPSETVDVNVVGTINLLNAIRDFSKESKLVIGGSGEEYGRMDFDTLPVSEDEMPHPNNIYGATKACQTMFAKLYFHAFGLNIVVLRTFYETSVLQDEKYAVSSFCKQFAEIEAGKRQPVINTGNLNNIRDFTDVNDLIKAFEAVAFKGVSGEVYNAARGQETTLLDIIKILSKLTGIQPTIKMDSSRVRPMDSPAIVANVSKIEKDCGWKAVIPIEKTIESILTFWRERV